MSKLMKSWKEKMAKSKDGSGKEAVFDVMYPTGFLTFDHLNGTMVHVNNKDINIDYKMVGIVDGSANTFIGRSGCGKSTLVTQIMGNMLKQFPDAIAYIDDIEGSLPMVRKEFLLGIPSEELAERVVIRNCDITTENVYNQIKSLHDIKLVNRAEYEYDTGLYDTYGNRIFKLIPTLYFIDSLPMLMPQDLAEDDEMDNGMGATSTAKKNTQLIKKISQLLRGANIILFTVNHILDDIQMGFLPKPVQIDGLKQGERMPGGKAAIYLANNLVRLDEKGKLKDSEGFGINGTIVDVTLVKSRTNATKQSVPLIFDKSNGAFDNILSIYQFLKAEGCIGGAGRSMYLEDAPDIKFSQKEFKTKLMENPELQKAFVQTAKNAMDKLLSDTKNQEEENKEIFDINSAILNLM